MQALDPILIETYKINLVLWDFQWSGLSGLQVLDSSRDQGEAISFQVGAGDVVGNKLFQVGQLLSDSRVNIDCHLRPKNTARC